MCKNLGCKYVFAFLDTNAYNNNSKNGNNKRDSGKIMFYKL